jgi:hypothetical protein
MAEYYSAELSQKVKRGISESRKKKQFTGGFLLYGYDVIDKKPVINEYEADIVRRIHSEYASGKTDALVYRGIKKGYDAEKNMLAAMEIQGQLYEGKSFAEIPKPYYFDQPQLCEDEPLFAVMLDLRYRYYLEKEDFDRAADCLNRLAQAQAYLPDSEVVKIAAELTYMHALNQDFERLQQTSEVCREYLAGESATAKRVLAAYAYAADKKEGIATLKAQAEESLAKERIKGLAKFERILLSRIAEE